MRRRIVIAICAAIAIAALGIVVAFVWSLPPLFDRSGKPMSYEAFWDAAERDEIAAASYDGTRATLYVAMEETGKTLDDLPQNCDYTVKAPIYRFWNDCDDWVLRRPQQGTTTDYGFAFSVEGTERRAGLYNTEPYLLLMSLLALSIGVMLYVTVKLRRGSRANGDTTRPAE